jgi:RNA polymerase sigma factor (sigma-70 family)
MTDELLVLRSQLGERAALAELVRAWHVPVWTYVRRMLDAERADDVAQEVWFAVFRGLPRLKDPSRFTAWLFTIARRTVADRLRAEYRRVEDPLDHEPVLVDPADAVLDRDALLVGLSELPVLEREILVLFYLEDLSVDSCADICGIPTGTVKSRLDRARRLLRAHLAEKGFHR